MRVRDPKTLLNRSLAGWNGKFDLAVRPFDGSAVACQERPPATPFGDGCDALLQTMPAGEDDQDIFGPAGAPGVTATLPYAHYTGCKILCSRNVVKTD